MLLTSTLTLGASHCFLLKLNPSSALLLVVSSWLSVGLVSKSLEATAIFIHTLFVKQQSCIFESSRYNKLNGSRIHSYFVFICSLGQVKSFKMHYKKADQDKTNEGETQNEDVTQDGGVGT